MPDFDIAAKRRIFDSGYYASLNNDNVELIQDDSVESLKEDSVVTANGVEVKADVVVLCTVRAFVCDCSSRWLTSYSSQGFKVQDCESFLVVARRIVTDD